MKENKNYTKAVLLFLNYPWNRERKISISGFFSPIWAFNSDMQQAGSGGVKTQFNWKANFVCEVLHEPAHPLPKLVSKAQEKPSPNHSIQGRKSSGSPGGKGRKGWANETNTLGVTDLQRCHLLDSWWKTKLFACSDMIQAQQSKPKVHWLICDPFHTSCPLVEELESRWVPDFIHKWVHTPRGLFPTLSISDASQHFLHNSS